MPPSCDKAASLLIPLAAAAAATVVAAVTLSLSRVSEFLKGSGSQFPSSDRTLIGSSMLTIVSMSEKEDTRPGLEML